MGLTFYTNPQSRGRIVRWMLEEVGQPYDTEVVPYGPPMKEGAYRVINPMGKVPALVHDGRIVTECAAICAYLADAFPEAGLAPTERSAYYRWLFFGAGPLEQAVVNGALGVKVPPERAGMVGYGSLDLVADVLSGAIDGREWLAGDAFSAADVYVGSQIVWGLQFGTLPDRPGFAAYRDRLVARPAYGRARDLDDALIRKD